MPISLICENCGSSFSVKPSVAAMPNKGRFCSRSCANFITFRGMRERDMDERFWSKLERLPSGCLIWVGCTDQAGYGQIRLSDNKLMRTHRLAYTLAIGVIKEGDMIRHLCDNPPCCEPSHLISGTQQDNMNDMTSRNRQAKGRNHGHAKIDEDDVMELRKSIAAGERQVDWSKRLGITQQTVNDIVRFRTWRHTHP